MDIQISYTLLTGSYKHQTLTGLTRLDHSSRTPDSTLLYLTLPLTHSPDTLKLHLTALTLSVCAACSSADRYTVDCVRAAPARSTRRQQTGLRL